jgi:hypothetical protein
MSLSTFGIGMQPSFSATFLFPPSGLLNHHGGPVSSSITIRHLIPVWFPTINRPSQQQLYHLRCTPMWLPTSLEGFLQLQLFFTLHFTFPHSISRHCPSSHFIEFTVQSFNSKPTILLRQQHPLRQRMTSPFQSEPLKFIFFNPPLPSHLWPITRRVLQKYFPFNILEDCFLPSIQLRPLGSSIISASPPLSHFDFPSKFAITISPFENDIL